MWGTAYNDSSEIVCNLPSSSAAFMLYSPPVDHVLFHKKVLCLFSLYRWKKSEIFLGHQHSLNKNQESDLDWQTYVRESPPVPAPHNFDGILSKWSYLLFRLTKHFEITVFLPYTDYKNLSLTKQISIAQWNTLKFSISCLNASVRNIQKSLSNCTVEF